MKERGIIFDGPMVRALLAGTKTQTRRVVQTARLEREFDVYPPGYFMLHAVPGGFDFVEWGTDHDRSTRISCPYGVPGDRLWVRESFNWSSKSELAPFENFRRCPERDGYSADCVVWRADGERAHPKWGKGLWRPSIHMPRWASRITLEVTEVRVQRVDAISESDAVAEGVGYRSGVSASYRHEFSRLWDSINGDRAPWSANPWVWVVSFRRVLP